MLMMLMMMTKERERMSVYFLKFWSCNFFSLSFSLVNNNIIIILRKIWIMMNFASYHDEFSNSFKSTIDYDDDDDFLSFVSSCLLSFFYDQHQPNEREREKN